MLRNAVILVIFLLTSVVSHAGTVKGQLDVASLSNLKIQRTGDGHFWDLSQSLQQTRQIISVPVAVVLENNSVKNLETRTPPVQLTIKGYGIFPALVTVRVGDELQIDNLDDHPYSCRIDGGPSSIVLDGLSPKQPRKVKIVAAGVLGIKCKKFPFMNSTIVASESPLSTVADHSGQFQIPNVPPGQYLAKVFTAGKLKWKKQIVVSSAASTKLSLGPTEKSTPAGKTPDLAEAPAPAMKTTDKKDKPEPRQITNGGNGKSKEAVDKKQPTQKPPVQKRPQNKQKIKPPTPPTKNITKKSNPSMKDKPIPTKNRTSGKTSAPSDKKESGKKKPATRPQPNKKKPEEGFKDVEPEIEIEVE